MSLAEILLPELDQEMHRTRRILASIPADRMDFVAHPGLRSIGWNANHLVEIVGWVLPVIEHAVFDIAPPDGPKYETPAIADPAELLTRFDENVAMAKTSLGTASDERLHAPWSLMSGGQTLFTISKFECLRTWVLNHTVHHRAILSVYLRMAGVDVVPAYDA